MIVAHEWKVRPSAIMQWTREEILLAAALLKWQQTQEPDSEGSTPDSDV